MKIKNKLIYVVFIFLFLNVKTENIKYNIGLLIVATDKYIKFVKPLIDSAEKYFCANHNIKFFVFTDDQNFKQNNVTRIYQVKLGWPYDTLMRFNVYLKNKDLFSNLDFLFACDADMLFEDVVGDEILSPLVATFHPGFYERNIKLPYEENKISKAFVNKNEGLNYFAGGFFGGNKIEFLKLLEITSKNINIDLQAHGYVAKFHDESHLNRYFIDNKPTKILSPSYCFPEDVLKLAHDDYKNIINLPKKLIALAKKDTTELHKFD